MEEQKGKKPDGNMAYLFNACINLQNVTISSSLHTDLFWCAAILGLFSEHLSLMIHVHHQYFTSLFSVHLHFAFDDTAT